MPHGAPLHKTHRNSKDEEREPAPDEGGDPAARHAAHRLAQEEQGRCGENLDHKVKAKYFSSFSISIKIVLSFYIIERLECRNSCFKQLRPNGRNDLLVYRPKPYKSHNLRTILAYKGSKLRFKLN